MVPAAYKQPAKVKQINLKSNPPKIKEIWVFVFFDILSSSCEIQGGEEFYGHPVYTPSLVQIKTKRRGKNRRKFPREEKDLVKTLHKPGAHKDNTVH